MRMLPANLITFEQAAAQLGLSESALDDLIDSGALATQPYLGDIYLLADQVTAHATTNPPAPKPKPERKEPDAKLTAIRNLKAAGVREVSGPEAARLLQVTGTQICHLLKEGRLNGYKRGRHQWIDIMEVEMYAMDQAHWASVSGRWTAYGKQEAVDPGMGLNLVSPARERPRLDQPSPQEDSDDYLLLIDQVASILGVCEEYARPLLKRNRIMPVRTKRETGKLNALGKRHVAAPAGYSARAVYAFADKRERKRSRAFISPTQWKERMVKPFIRTTIEAPPNDILVTRAEAAQMLGVSVSKISELVAKGRLFGWQTQPGKSGVPLYLSGNQVIRYRDDPDRLKRRAAYNRGPKPPSPLGQETEGEIWLENTGLAVARRESIKSNLDRNHGEFLNTRQVAKMLHVTTGAVATLRKRGRLNGYQKPRTKEDGGGHKWWFYRRKDIDELLLDGEYRRRSARCRTAKLRSLGRWIPETEPTW